MQMLSPCTSLSPAPNLGQPSQRLPAASLSRVSGIQRAALPALQATTTTEIGNIFAFSALREIH